MAEEQMTELHQPEKQEKEMALLVHAASFAGYLIPFGSVLGPLIVWLMKRDESAFVNQAGINCLNFKISMLIYFMVSFLLMFVLVGFVLVFALAILDIVVTILAMVRASEGSHYQYPFSIKFIK
ncbi:DUF4870 domain-containing protein [Shewanella khirikhana]|uniref:DUF4870 domain-containing protein n=1 Tax=Shewanella khirikhana TaxID=1965282 RepID=A0ABN5TZW0_9GAMM|nr:DUF4870 domain-containing protein [Shewanella khirikhana]AZQ12531.1 hypothetical protein STH12_03472 [Shewanella khirikhana]